MDDDPLREELRNEKNVWTICAFVRCAVRRSSGRSHNHALDYHQQPDVGDGHMSDGDLHRAFGRRLCDLSNNSCAGRVVWRIIAHWREREQLRAIR
jgi:hypothetical protein